MKGQCEFCQKEDVETEGTEFTGNYCKECLEIVINSCQHAIWAIEKREDEDMGV